MRSDVPDSLDPAIHALIRAAAASLLGCGGFTESDREDLEQELTLRLLQKWWTYNPQRSRPEVFASVVLKTVRRNLLRDRFAAKRDPRRVRSLDALRACHDPRLEGWLEEPASPVFQVAEVEGFWSTLSPADRDLLDRRRTQSVAAIARTLGLSRHDIQRRFAQLQRQAHQAGLTDDLVK